MARYKTLSLIVLVACTLALSSCGVLDSIFEGNESEFKAYRVAGSNQGQVATVSQGGEYSAGRISPPASSTPTDLFAQKLPTDKARIDRLEKTVQNLYESLQLKVPHMAGLHSMEQNVSALAAGHGQTSRNPEAHPAVPGKMRPVELVQFGGAAKPQAIRTQGGMHTPSSHDAGAKLPVAQKPRVSGIQDVRVSQNGGTTRVVLDSTKKIDYIFDYDTGEGIVLISAPNANTAGNFSSRAGKSKHIRTLNATKNGANTDLILTLSGPANISAPTLLSPNKDSQYYRYYFDIKS